MRKIVIFLLIIVFHFNVYVGKNTFALSNDFGYAKILSNCVLYKNSSMIDDYSNVLFILPESYFVLIIDDTVSGCYKVKYDNYVGFVKSDKIKVVDFVPQNKILSGVTFDIKKNSGTQVWSMPTTNSEILTTIKASTENVSYVASTNGDVPSGGTSGVWYYAVYTSPDNPTNVYEGYVYSENVFNLSEIKLNDEDMISSEIENLNKSAENNLSNLKIIIIVLVLIPLIIFLMLILYKSIKKVAINTNKNKNQNKYKNEKFDNFVSNQTNFNQNSLDFEHQNKIKRGIDFLSKTSFKKIPKNIDSHIETFEDDDELL